MSLFVLKKEYKSSLGLIETEAAIKDLKDFFERRLADALYLKRVSAPLFVTEDSGLNDDLNGVERPVAFGIKDQGDRKVQIVHSLAKWKRHALKRYGFSAGTGLYADMNAIRRDEDTDNIHSIYVDQWDWERIISKDERNIETLKQTVRKIYKVLKETEAYAIEKYPVGPSQLREDIHFVTSQEMEDRYPNLTPKEREYEYAKEFGSIFIIGIGGKLNSGKKHDGRAPDYDDWTLNGDIIVYYDTLDIALELSSMGVRVDEEALISQLNEAGCSERASLPFQKALLSKELPYTIGGGIGQSRLCMLFLKKAHIGEVQASIWKDEDVRVCAENNIALL